MRVIAVRYPLMPRLVFSAAAHAWDELDRIHVARVSAAHPGWCGGLLRRGVSRMRPSALSGLHGMDADTGKPRRLRVAALAWRVALLLLAAGAGLQRARLLQVLGDVFAGGGQVLAHVLAGGRGNQL